MQPPQFHFRSEIQSWSPSRQRKYELSLKRQLTPQEQEELALLQGSEGPPPFNGAAVDEGSVSSHGGVGVGSEGHGVPSHLRADSDPQPMSRPKRRPSQRVVDPERSNVSVEIPPFDPPQESQGVADPEGSNVSMDGPALSPPPRLFRTGREQLALRDQM